MKKLVTMVGITALSVTAHAADGVNYSGSNARNESLQSNYLSLVDSYNIWGNPALVNKYSNRVDLNINASASVSDRGALGLYRTFSFGTLGFFVGRPQVEAAANTAANTAGWSNDVSTYASQIAGHPANSSAVAAVGSVQAPVNQFDVFYGLSAGLDFGARLNIQRRSTETTSPRSDVLTPNDGSNLLVNSGFGLGGLRTDSTLAASRNLDSDAFNLAVGVADPSGKWDAALAYGSPSAEAKTAFSIKRLDQHRAGTATITRTDTSTVDASQTVKTDDANELSLTARLIDVVAPKSILSAYYESSKYNFVSDGTGTYVQKVDLNNDGTYPYGVDTNTTKVIGKGGNLDQKVNRYVISFTKDFDVLEHAVLRTTVAYQHSDEKVTWLKVNTKDVTTDNSTGLPAGTVNPQYNLLGGNCNNGTNDLACLGSQGGQSTDVTTNNIPLVVSIEDTFNTNWKLRASVSKDLYRSTDTDVTTDTYAYPDSSTVNNPATTIDETLGWRDIPVKTIKTASSGTNSTDMWNTPTTLALGAAYNRGKFTVDAVVQRTFFQNGVGNNGFLGRVNATWLMK